MNKIESIKKLIKKWDALEITTISMYCAVMALIVLACNHAGARLFFTIQAIIGTAILDTIAQKEIHKLWDEIARIRDDEP